MIKSELEKFLFGWFLSEKCSPMLDGGSADMWTVTLTNFQKVKILAESIGYFERKCAIVVLSRIETDGGWSGQPTMLTVTVVEIPSCRIWQSPSDDWANRCWQQNKPRMWTVRARAKGLRQNLAVVTWNFGVDAVASTLAAFGRRLSQKVLEVG